ncbi:MAG: hypothetical protein AAFU79_21045 [Myxococcota bacterium]
MSDPGIERGEVHLDARDGVAALANDKGELLVWRGEWHATPTSLDVADDVLVADDGSVLLMANDEIHRFGVDGQSSVAFKAPQHRDLVSMQHRPEGGLLVLACHEMYLLDPSLEVREVIASESIGCGRLAAFTSRGDLVVIGASEHEVVVHDAKGDVHRPAKKRGTRALLGHPSGVVVAARNERITGSDQASIHRTVIESSHDGRTWTQEKVIEGAVTSMAMTGDGTILIALASQRVLAWSLGTQRMVELPSVEGHGALRPLALQADGRSTFVAGHWAGENRVARFEASCDAPP